MSGFGIFLLMAALLIALLALIKFFSYLTILQERGGVMHAARDAIGRYASVNRLLLPAPAPLSPKDRQTETDERPDVGLSVADQWLDRLEVDKTRATWVELMVYSGYTVADIRGLLKGDNAIIGQEVAAARQRLGMGDDPPRMLKVREGANERVIPA